MAWASIVKIMLMIDMQINNTKQYSGFYTNIIGLFYSVKTV
jgi:hypothetical protein